MKVIVWEGGVPWKIEGHVAGFNPKRMKQICREAEKELSHIRLKRLRKGNRSQKMRKAK